MVRKSSTYNNLNQIFEALTKKKISAYQAVDLVHKLNPKSSQQLLSELITNKKPFFRLICAWCLGKVNNAKTKRTLEFAFKSERNNNVRANIVWAYMTIASPKPSLYKKFLCDRYFLIRLVALKRIRPNTSFYHNISMSRFLSAKEHPLVRIEAIRKSHYFNTDKWTMHQKIKSTLLRSTNSFEIGACLRAIGKFEDGNIVDFLSTYYANNRTHILSHTNIIVSFCRAISDSNESAAYAILRDIYTSLHSSELVRYCTIEALAIGGGPNSYKVLEEISNVEKNEKLSQFVKTIVSSTQITDV